MPMHPIRRRSFLLMGTASVMAAGLGEAAWRKALGATAVIGESPYGAPGAPDLNGVAVPAGFGTRLLATTGSVVAGTEYSWHGQPDGGSCFADSNGALGLCLQLRAQRHARRSRCVEIHERR